MTGAGMVTPEQLQGLDGFPVPSEPPMIDGSRATSTVTMSACDR